MIRLSFRDKQFEKLGFLKATADDWLRISLDATSCLARSPRRRATAARKATMYATMAARLEAELKGGAL